MSGERNLVAVRVSASAIAQIVTTSAWMDDMYTAGPQPFPEDTHYVRAYYDAEIDSFIMVFEHPSFYRTTEGAQIMRIKVVMPPDQALLTGG